MGISIRLVVIIGVACLLSTIVPAQGGIRKVKFSYSGSNGPEHWGELDPDYKRCSTGKQQSPINIAKRDWIFNSSLKALDRYYEPVNATFINNGFNIQLLFEKEVGVASIQGKNYSLLQLHWHTPSEHTLHGQKYAAELHLVHKSDDGNYAVVAILYKFGDADDFIDHLKDQLDELAKAGYPENEVINVAAGEVDTRSLRRKTRKYFQYMGSLSTPPCYENIHWTILGKVRSISKEQVVTLRAPLPDVFKKNSRPTQLLYGRTVELYQEHHKVKTRSL